VTDDWNLEDEFVDGCARFLEEHPEDFGRDEAVYRECIRLLRECSEGERASALALVGGYPREDGG
jgi:hypothetical protein